MKISLVDSNKILASMQQFLTNPVGLKFFKGGFALGADARDTGGDNQVIRTEGYFGKNPLSGSWDVHGSPRVEAGFTVPGSRICCVLSSELGGQQATGQKTGLGTQSWSKLCLPYAI